MDDELVAIDVHTHLAAPEAIGHMEAMGAYFKREVRGVPIEETVAMYRGMRNRRGPLRGGSGDPGRAVSRKRLRR